MLVIPLSRPGCLLSVVNRLFLFVGGRLVGYLLGMLTEAKEKHIHGPISCHPQRQTQKNVSSTINGQSY